MSSALVKPLLLRWARERARMRIEDIADTLGTVPMRVLQWEEGKELPTFKQAQKIAHITHIPFGYLFLSTPPIETFPIPDLRTIAGRPDTILPSPDFRDLVTDVVRKRDWYIDYLRDIEASPLPFVAKDTRKSPPKQVAADIAKTLGINDDLRERARSWEDYLGTLIKLAEQARIWVIRSGIVGNNTHRPLSVDEFRGFAISDVLAPLIFINGKDAKAAQMFTLAHELAHIWIGESGVSDLSLETKLQSVVNTTEIFCNQVAVELLVPHEVFVKRWNKALDINHNATTAANYFRVSGVVAARRAFDLGLIDDDTYWDFYNEHKRQWKKASETSEGGGDFYRTLKTRNGTLFSSAVLTATYGGNLAFREAASLLNTKVGNLDKFAKFMGIR